MCQNSSIRSLIIQLPQKPKPFEDNTSTVFKCNTLFRFLAAPPSCYSRFENDFVILSKQQPFQGQLLEASVSLLPVTAFVHDPILSLIVSQNIFPTNLIIPVLPSRVNAFKFCNHYRSWNILEFSVCINNAKQNVLMWTECMRR